MGFQMKPTRKKVSSVYKSLYINEQLAERVEQMAKENETSFNNVVISIKSLKKPDKELSDDFFRFDTAAHPDVEVVDLR